MKISILGCGWFGTALSRSLTRTGIQVKGSTTSAHKLDGVRTHLVKIASAADSVVDADFFDCDLLVVANNVRMNDKALYLQRVIVTIELAERFHIPKVVFISSTSVYGEPGQIIDENTTPHPETLSANLLYQAEQLFKKASFKVVVLRFAGLFGPGRDPGKFFAGKINIPNGLAPVNLLHLEDAVGLTMQVIQNGSDYQIINAVAPGHPSKMDFYSLAARQSGLELPIFIAERVQWKIVRSRYTGYRYKHNLLS